jgi:copper(I)-binding protein
MGKMVMAFWLRVGFVPAMVFALASAAFAHGSSKGDLRVEHAYASTGTSEAVVYFRGLRNEGEKPERLLRGNTPVAAAVELQRRVQSGGAQTAAAVAAIELPGKTNTPMRHDKGEYRLLLKGLKQPLQDGDRFDLTLFFEHTGTLVVKVWVQATP